MQMREAASLLDDAQFVEELAKLEALPSEDTSAFPKPVPTVGENAQPAAIADELPPALRPRTSEPQFVLAPPPSRRRSTSHRVSSTRAAVRIRMASNDDQHAATTESVSAAGASSSASADEEANGQSRRFSPVHPALAVVGFVLMMSVGAGAAALVFHDRVEQIVTLWQTARN
jgi:hypothetical protein